MSQLTRRQLLRTWSTLAGSVVLSACSELPVSLNSTSFGQRPIVVWSTNNQIDTAIARWRRLHPNLAVRRQSFNRETLRTRIQEIQTERDAPPDVVIADTYTIRAVENVDMWRHIDDSQSRTTYVPAAIDQTRRDQQRLFAYPLAVNPLRLWYHTTLIEDGLGVSDSSSVSSALGSTYDTMRTALTQLHRANPHIATFATCFDDVAYPFIVQSYVQNTSLSDAVAVSYALAQAHIVGRTTHFSGEWFDLLNRQNIAFIVGGRWIGHALERMNTSGAASLWRSVTHPLGHIFGPGLVAAIPVQSSNYEAAQRFAIEMSSTEELQILISEASGTLPVANTVYAGSFAQQVDSMLPENTVAAIWATAQHDRYTALTPEQIIMVERLKKLFYAWQQHTITDSEFTQAIEYALTS